MRSQCSKWHCLIGTVILGLGLTATTGCISLDYFDWNDFNDAVVGGAIDGTGAFVEDTFNAILTTIFDGIRGMPDAG